MHGNMRRYSPFETHGRPWNSIKGGRRFLRTSTKNRAKDWYITYLEYKRNRASVTPA